MSALHASPGAEYKVQGAKDGHCRAHQSKAESLMQHTALLRLPEVSKGLCDCLGPLVPGCEQHVDRSSNEPSAR